ncbi:cupin domain-containing protein [Haloferacaceae archaeon DSL9]
MGYRLVDPDSVDPVPDRPCELRRLSAATTLDAVAINQFRAAPGEQLPLAYHYHETQDEAFYVVSGTLRVETPDETYTVGEGQLFAAPAEHPHRAYNPEDATEPVVAVAIGAPAVDGDAVRYDPDE